MVAPQIHDYRSTEGTNSVRHPQYRESVHPVGPLRRKRIVRTSRRLAIVFAIFLAAVLSLAIQILVVAGQSDSAPADAAVVLGAAVDGDTPSPVFEERLRHAAALLDSGQVQWIVLTGGVGHGDGLTEAEAGRTWLVEQGLPPDRLLVEAQSRTTRQNLAYALPILTDHDAERILIVSDPLHMRRALRIATDLGIDAHPSPTPTTRYRSVHTQIPMLLREVYHSAHYPLTRQ